MGATHSIAGNFIICWFKKVLLQPNISNDMYSNATNARIARPISSVHSARDRWLIVKTVTYNRV